MEARKRVAVNIQRLRREQDLSQEELGTLANVHQTYLSQVEGMKRNPSIDVLRRSGGYSPTGFGPLLHPHWHIDAAVRN